MKIEKTNAMRILEGMKINYTARTYDPKVTDSTVVASLLGAPAEQVFKTLVVRAEGRRYYVFMLPCNKTLGLKAAAAACGEKSVEMLPQKELFPLTGYVHGGCSPLGMKKAFPSYIDVSCLNCESIFFSGGKLGCNIEVSVNDLIKAVPLETAVFAV